MYLHNNITFHIHTTKLRFILHETLITHFLIVLIDIRKDFSTLCLELRSIQLLIRIKYLCAHTDLPSKRKFACSVSICVTEHTLC